MAYSKWEKQRALLALDEAISKSDLSVCFVECKKKV